MEKEKSTSNDFESEVKKLWNEINTGHSYSILDSYNQFYGMCLDIAEWQKQKDESKVLTEEQCRKIRDDAFELGKDAMKQQLMAKAIDAVVKIDAGGYPYVDATIELYDYDKDIPLAKNGDKVKIIVTKEN